MIELLQELTAVSDTDEMFNLADSQLNNVPFHIYSKDLTGKYIACNDTQAITLGFDRGADVIGMTDFDLCDAITAHHLHLTDRSVIFQGKSQMLIEHVTTLKNREFNTFSCKLPLHNSTNKIIGILGLSFIINPQEVLNKLQGPNTNTANKRTRQDLDINMQNSTTDQLTQRQQECLYCLVTGMTIKQIATELGLSPRTVEHHIESIKNKLRCNSRSELIAKALKLQFIKDRLIGD